MTIIHPTIQIETICHSIWMFDEQLERCKHANLEYFYASWTYGKIPDHINVGKCPDCGYSAAPIEISWYMIGVQFN